MKNSPSIALRTLLAAASLLVASIAGAEVVYNNSSNSVARFNPGLAEVGDEVTLAGTDRTISLFVFQYWGVSFSGNETARLRFYANDGPAAPAGPTIYAPGTLLFDSGTFSILETSASTIVFDQTALGGGVLVPGSFTWSVQFGGTDGAGESAGVDLFSPPTVGGNYSDYWDNGTLTWEYRTITVDSTNVPANFGAYIEAVPEPSSIVLGLLGGLAIWGWKRSRRN